MPFLLKSKDKKKIIYFLNLILQNIYLKSFNIYTKINNNNNLIITSHNYHSHNKFLIKKYFFLFFNFFFYDSIFIYIYITLYKIHIMYK